MIYEVVASILVSVGGASAILAAFVHYLGKIWAERITVQLKSRYENEFELLRAKNAQALEVFRHQAAYELKDVDVFSGISTEVYRDFFKRRVDVYAELLRVKDEYITRMQEDFYTHETERWGDVYNDVYKSLKKIIITNQLYISNELDKEFHKFRVKAADYIQEADLVEAYGLGANSNHDRMMSDQDVVLNKFATETGDSMHKVLERISEDVANIRSRIDMDRSGSLANKAT